MSRTSSIVNTSRDFVIGIDTKRDRKTSLSLNSWLEMRQPEMKTEVLAIDALLIAASSIAALMAVGVMLHRSLLKQS